MKRGLKPAINLLSSGNISGYANRVSSDMWLPALITRVRGRLGRITGKPYRTVLRGSLERELSFRFKVATH